MLDVDEILDGFNEIADMLDDNDDDLWDRYLLSVIVIGRHYGIEVTVNEH